MRHGCLVCSLYAQSPAQWQTRWHMYFATLRSARIINDIQVPGDGKQAVKIKVLGCSGGIGDGLRTTSFLVDDDILVDAGTGVGDLPMHALLSIDHIFVTHAHLDHIACIPFLVDTVLGIREKPVTLHATLETWGMLKDHIFNWKIWPDFNVIPTASDPFLRYEEITVGEAVELNGRKITALPANHVVPAVGFRIDSGAASLVFSGDTAGCDAFWDMVNNMDNLRYLVIETAFSNGEIDLAMVSKHLCPSMLVEELRKLQRPAQIFISHLKPGEDQVIMREVSEQAAAFSPTPLHNQQVFQL